MWKYWHAPLERAADGGGGGGAAAPAAGAGGTSDPAGATGGGGSPSTFKLTDDSLLDFGDGKPVKWSEARGSRYMDRSEYDKGMREVQQGRDFLIGQAQRLEGAWQAYQRGQGPKPQQTRPSQQDLLEEIRGQAAVDGQSVHKLITALNEQGLSPIAQIVAQQQAKITQLERQFGGFSQQQGQLTDQHQSQVFDSLITRHGGAIGEVPGFHGTIDVKEPAVRELLKDIWLSHNQREWTDASFVAEARGRLAQLVDYVRRSDRGYVTQQKEEKRQRFMNPNRGNSTPGGDPRYKHESSTQIAKQFFDYARDRT